LALTPSEDDGFREIQLNGKQLVFLFMAVTVVLVVTFLSGVLVGRGVRAERADVAQADALNESPATPPERTAVATPADADPRNAAPPPAAEEDAPQSRGARASEPLEEPPVAVRRADPADSRAASPKPPDTIAKAAPAPVRSPAAAEKAATPPPARAAAEPATTAPSTEAASPSRSGYAVQVAAVNGRGEADAIVKRLAGKGYSAYLEVPRGKAKMFRVRVGTFRTRREAQTIAAKLKREEKFKPWVTR